MLRIALRHIVCTVSVLLNGPSNCNLNFHIDNDFEKCLEIIVKRDNASLIRPHLIILLIYKLNTTLLYEILYL